MKENFSATFESQFTSTGSVTYVYSTNFNLGRILPKNYIGKKVKISCDFHTGTTTVLHDSMILFWNNQSPNTYNNINEGIEYLGSARQTLNNNTTNQYDYNLNFEESNQIVLNVNSSFYDVPLVFTIVSLNNTNHTQTCKFIITLKFELLE